MPWCMVDHSGNICQPHHHGRLAISRFLRPVCYQGLPSELLPDELRDDTVRKLPRLVDGRRT